MFRWLSETLRGVHAFRRRTHQAIALLEVGLDAMLVVNAEGAIVDANEPAARLFGHERADLIGSSIERLVPDSLRAVHIEYRARFARDAQRRAMGARRELNGLRSDGTEFPIEVTLAPIRGPGGTLVLSAIRDLSERNAAEGLFRDLLESAPDAMVIINTQGRIVLVNAQVEALFGYQRDQLVGERVEVLVPERFHAVHSYHVQSYIEQPRVRRMGGGSLDLSGRRKDGSEFPVEIGLSPIQRREGLWVASTIRDATERREIEINLRMLAQGLEHRAAQLARSNAELEEFAYVISHDLKSPLRAASSLAEWLHADCFELLDDTGKRHLELLRGRVQWMHRLVGAVLDYSRATRTVKLQIVDADEVARAAVARLDPPSHIAVRIDEKLPSVRYDATLLARVFQNLIGNALDHAAGGREIHVSAVRTAEGHEFRVRDSGPGIPEEHRERIFRMFQTLGAARASTGMGLAIVKKIVESRAGRVGVRAAPEHGAEFFFTIPAD